MKFTHWLIEKEKMLKREMAGTGAIVGCKDRNNPNFQIWGALSDLNCKKKKKK